MGWWYAVVFAARRQWGAILAAALVMVVAFAATHKAWFPGRWAVIDPILTLGTLGAALLVWLGEARQDWERSLPQQITVEFRMQHRVAFRCERAPLLDEAPRA